VDQVDLAAAVSNAGALGSLGTALRMVPDLRAQWTRLRDLTGRPFAINHTLRPLDMEAFEATLREGPAAISFHIGDPGDLVRRTHDAGILAASATFPPCRRAGDDVHAHVDRNRGLRQLRRPGEPLRPQLGGQLLLCLRFLTPGQVVGVGPASAGTDAGARHRGARRDRRDRAAPSRQITATLTPTKRLVLTATPVIGRSLERSAPTLSADTRPSGPGPPTEGTIEDGHPADSIRRMWSGSAPELAGRIRRRLDGAA